MHTLQILDNNTFKLYPPHACAVEYEGPCACNVYWKYSQSLFSTLVLLPCTQTMSLFLLIRLIATSWNQGCVARARASLDGWSLKRSLEISWSQNWSDLICFRLTKCSGKNFNTFNANGWIELCGRIPSTTYGCQVPYVYVTFVVRCRSRLLKLFCTQLPIPSKDHFAIPHPYLCNYATVQWF